MNRLVGWIVAELLLAPTLGYAQEPPVPGEDVPPAVADDVAAGEAAWKAGRLDEAAEAFTRVTTAAPEWDRGWRRRCGVVLETGDALAAIGHCRTAMERADTPENQVALAIALLRPEDEEALPQGRPELDEAGALLASVTQAHPEVALAWPALCEWAIATSDADALRRCVPEVRARLPDDPGTPFWAALLAIEEGQGDLARRMLGVARDRGVDPRLLAVARARLDNEAATPKREGAKTVALDTFAPVGAAGAVLLFIGLALLSSGRRAAGGPGNAMTSDAANEAVDHPLPTHDDLHPRPEGDTEPPTTTPGSAT
jgi:hypothetical protein